MTQKIQMLKEESPSGFERFLSPIQTSLLNLERGENILIRVDDSFSLLKYEGVELGSTNPFEGRYNRQSYIGFAGTLFMQRPDHPYTHEDPSKRIVEEAKIDILGTHRLDFNFDKEFEIYLPSAEQHTDLYLTLANKFGDDRIERTFENIEIIADPSLLMDQLQQITRPDYFKQNVLPFLENQPTNLEMPKWTSNSNLITGLITLLKNRRNRKDKGKPRYNKFGMSEAHDWLSRATKDSKHGDFVYVGSKEEVYLFGITKEADGSQYMQGTYTTSTKPMLWFSNNYLGHMSKQDMKKPMFPGGNLCNVAKYRMSNAPNFDEESFIFSAMGRSQDCKNSIFNGEPDIITGKLSEALNHFKTTDFKEFSDVVEAYAKRIHEPTPEIKLRKGNKYFY